MSSDHVYIRVKRPHIEPEFPFCVVWLSDGGRTCQTTRGNGASAIGRTFQTVTGYEVNYFARKHGITAEQARGLIKKIGNDREKLNKAAARL